MKEFSALSLDSECPQLKDTVDKMTSSSVGVSIEELDSIQLELESLLTNGIERLRLLKNYRDNATGHGASTSGKSNRTGASGRGRKRRRPLSTSESNNIAEEKTPGKIQKRQSSHSLIIAALKRNYVFLPTNPVLEKFWPYVRESWLNSRHYTDPPLSSSTIDDALQLYSLRMMKRQSQAGCPNLITLTGPLKASLQRFTQRPMAAKDYKYKAAKSQLQLLMEDLDSGRLNPDDLRWRPSTRLSAEQALAKLTIVDQRIFLHVDKAHPRRSDFTRDCKERDKACRNIRRIKGLEDFVGDYCPQDVKTEPATKSRALVRSTREG